MGRGPRALCRMSHPGPLPRTPRLAGGEGATISRMNRHANSPPPFSRDVEDATWREERAYIRKLVKSKNYPQLMAAIKFAAGKFLRGDAPPHGDKRTFEMDMIFPTPGGDMVVSLDEYRRMEERDGGTQVHTTAGDFFSTLPYRDALETVYVATNAAADAVGSDRSG